MSKEEKNIFILNTDLKDYVNIIENKLLEALLTKCAEKIGQQEENNGLIKIKLIKTYLLDKADAGYKEIENLVKTGNFDSFGSKYCFSLGTIKSESDYTSPYDIFHYEVIWDYNAFLEKLNVLSLLSGYNMEKDFAIYIDNFKKLPLKYQITILAKFIEIVNDAFSKYAHDIAVDTCKKEGHIFGEWKYKKYRKYIDTVIDHQYIPDFPIECEDWTRSCNRCGFVEKANSEPQELIEVRKTRRRKKPHE